MKVKHTASYLRCEGFRISMVKGCIKINASLENVK